MRYMMLVCLDETQDPSEDERVAMERSGLAWAAEMNARKVRLDGSRLRPSYAAVSVRVRRGDVIISDGPFAETAEQIAGYDIIECAHLDEAIEIAAKHPIANLGTVEIRPIWEC